MNAIKMLSIHGDDVMELEKKIDRTAGSLPIYRQLSKILEVEIRDNYMTGDALPSEHCLAERFQVNRHTLRRAVDELIGAGFVERLHGIGTIVLQSPINYAINRNTRFTETLESQGRRTASRVIKKEKIRARGGVARRLRIVEGTPVTNVETMRKVDGMPFCTSSHFLPYGDFSALLHEYDGGSLHHFLQQRYARKLRRILSLISAVMPNKEDARRLNLPRNTPVLRVKSLNVDKKDGWPVEYVVTRFRGDGVQLSVRP
jgi:GntR family phosphonate transport system transcriptional regulator